MIHWSYKRSFKKLKISYEGLFPVTCYWFSIDCLQIIFYTHQIYFDFKYLMRLKVNLILHICMTLLTYLWILRQQSITKYLNILQRPWLETTALISLAYAGGRSGFTNRPDFGSVHSPLKLLLMHHQFHSFLYLVVWFSVCFGIEGRHWRKSGHFF